MSRSSSLKPITIRIYGHQFRGEGVLLFLLILFSIAFHQFVLMLVFFVPLLALSWIILEKSITISDARIVVRDIYFRKQVIDVSAITSVEYGTDAEERVLIINCSSEALELRAYYLGKFGSITAAGFGAIFKYGRYPELFKYGKEDLSKLHGALVGILPPEKFKEYVPPKSLHDIYGDSITRR